ncbi:MAG: hypothetical protein ACYC5A_09965, partial [Thermoleophilia bacterium]
PIIHIRALVNLAWIKNPTIESNLLTSELIALCSAALRPSQATWERFLKHLESLRKSQRISSDEQTAIVISSMSDRLLREAEMEVGDPSDIDAVTLDEVAERVKASYSAKAMERVRSVEEEYQSLLADAEIAANKQLNISERQRREAEDKLRKQEQTNRIRAGNTARYVCCGLHWFLRGVIIIGAVAVVTGHPFHGGLIGSIIAVAIIVFVVIEMFGILKHVSEIRNSLEKNLEARIEVWLSGKKK